MLVIHIKGEVVEVMDTAKAGDVEGKEKTGGKNASVLTVENSGILNASASCQAVALTNQDMMIQVTDAVALLRKLVLLALTEM